MYSPKILLAVFSNHKPKVLSSLRNIHAVQVLNQQIPPYAYYDGGHADRSLFFTNLPVKKREKKVKVKVGQIPSGSLVIKCKNENLNHYSGMHYGKFDVIPLASKGWNHRKSKGDYFTILPSKLHPAFFTKEDLPETFEENGISEKVIEQLKKINVTHPTVIQAKSITNLLKGQNVFISSECGSGKTLCYLIATIENVCRLKNAVSNSYNSPYAIILLPTKELALQIGVNCANYFDHFQKAHTLCSELGINCQTLIGGEIKKLMLNPQMNPVDILICTPLVIKKHLVDGLYSTDQCKHVILDEADSLFEEDFFQQMKEFARATKLSFTGLFSPAVMKNCSQICFVSATAPKVMESRLHELIKTGSIVTVATPHLHKVVSHVHQLFMRVNKQQRPAELLKIVRQTTMQKIPTIIFSNDKSTSNWVSYFLGENGVKCPVINKSLDPAERFRNFRDFQLGIVHCISCTDLGSRGLHFENVKRVINFEFPSFMADYIHRCGRTGRLGQGDDCLITNFIASKREIPLLNKIEKAVRTNTQLPSVHNDRYINYELRNRIRKRK